MATLGKRRQKKVAVSRSEYQYEEEAPDVVVRVKFDDGYEKVVKSTWEITDKAGNPVQKLASLSLRERVFCFYSPTKKSYAARVISTNLAEQPATGAKRTLTFDNGTSTVVEQKKKKKANTAKMTESCQSASQQLLEQIQTWEGSDIDSESAPECEEQQAFSKGKGTTLKTANSDAKGDSSDCSCCTKNKDQLDAMNTSLVLMRSEIAEQRAMAASNAETLSQIYDMLFKYKSKKSTSTPLSSDVVSLPSKSIFPSSSDYRPVPLPPAATSSSPSVCVEPVCVPSESPIVHALNTNSENDGVYVGIPDLV